MRWGYTARRLLASVRADREKHVAESEQVVQELQKEREGRARDLEGHEGERRAWIRDKDDLLERCKAASMNWERERQVWKVATQDWEKEKHELTQMREEKEQALQAERAMRAKDREEWQGERLAHEREREESRRERDEAIKAWAREREVMERAHAQEKEGISSRLVAERQASARLEGQRKALAEALACERHKRQGELDAHAREGERWRQERSKLEARLEGARQDFRRIVQHHAAQHGKGAGAGADGTSAAAAGGADASWAFAPMTDFALMTEAMAQTVQQTSTALSHKVWSPIQTSTHKVLSPIHASVATLTPSPASTQFFEGLFSAGGEALGAEGEEEQEDLFLANLRLLSQAAPATSTAEAAGRMTQDSKVSDKAASSGEDSCSAPMLATCVPKVSGAVASLPLDNEVRVSASACATACGRTKRERERERERERVKPTSRRGRGGVLACM